MEANEFPADVLHAPGRRWTGLRRVTVCRAKKAKLSLDTLRKLGGRADNQLAGQRYADDEQEYALEEARDSWARLRGVPTEGHGR